MRYMIALLVLCLIAIYIVIPLKIPSWALTSVKLVKAVLAFVVVVLGVLPIVVSYKGPDGSLTRWGRVAFAIGLVSAFLTAGITVVEVFEQERATAKSLDHQSRVIGDLRRLVAPLSGMKFRLYFTATAGQPSLRELTKFAETQIRPPGRYIQLLRPPWPVAELGTSDFCLYFCKIPSCMATREWHPDLTVILQNKPGSFEESLSASRVTFDSVEKKYGVLFEELTASEHRVGPLSDAIVSTEDLTGANVFMIYPAPDIEYQMLSLTIGRANGQVLGAGLTKTVVPSQFGGDQLMLAGKLSEKWF